MSRRRSSSKIYCSDKRLIPRIKEILSEEPVVQCSSDDLVDVLQATYPEYGRRKKNTFKSQVEKVYRQLLDNDPRAFDEYEKEYMRRNAAGNGVGEDGFSSDSEADALIVDGNLMNQLMTDVYENGNSSNHTPRNRTPGLTATTTSNQDNPADSVTTETKPFDPVKNEDDSMTRKRPHDIVDDNGNKITTRKKRKKHNPKKDEGLEDNISDAIKKNSLVDVNVIYPTARFADFGGYESVVKDVCQVLIQFRHPEIFNHLGIAPPQGFLLNGPPGCGKTLLAHAIAGELGWPMLCLTSTEIVSGVSGESEEKLRNIFNKAKEQAPCVLFIDEIDAISPKRELVHREMERRIVTQLLSCMDDLLSNRNTSLQSGRGNDLANNDSNSGHSNKSVNSERQGDDLNGGRDNDSNSGRGGVKQVLVIGATSRLESLDPCLRRSGRFDREVCLGMPSQQYRAEIIHLLIKDMRVDDCVSVDELSHLTPGYVGADLSCLVREAAMTAVSRAFSNGGTCDQSLQSLRERLRDNNLMKIPMDTVSINNSDFKDALTRVIPSSKREGFATVPDITWKDIGALKDVRDELTLAILAPVRFPEQFSRLGLKQPPGILLAGPPGCGKTLLAKAIANESGINFISVKGPELLNMYVGESERAVRQVFQRARNSAPCVIFFDEIDALCPKRSDLAENSSSARVVNQLLTEMDGLEARKQVFLMGATNRPDIIDPAILRPGRLDKILHVNLPCAKDRSDILRTITKNGTIPPTGLDVDLEALADETHTKGYSGADLAALVREASCLALKEYMSLSATTLTSLSVAGDNDCIVFKRHFDKALEKLSPSVTDKEKRRYNQFFQE